MKLVTVYRTFSLAEAHVVRSRLDAARFHPEIANETAALSIEGYSQAAGGILVQVPDDEAVAARELIEDCESGHA